MHVQDIKMISIIEWIIFQTNYMQTTNELKIRSINSSECQIIMESNIHVTQYSHSYPAKQS